MTVAFLMTSNVARRALPTLTIAVGAFVAALALATTVSPNFVFVVGGGDRFDVFFRSEQSATALGAIVAVVAAVLVVRVRVGLIATGFGIVLLAAATTIDFSAEIHVRGLAAGLILGGCAALTGSSRLFQCALMIGVVSALVAAGPLETSLIRYDDYLAPTRQTYLIVLVGVFTVLLAIAVWASAFDDSPRPTPNALRILLVGIVIPVVGLILYWLLVRSVASLGSNGAMQNRWLLGIAVIPLLVGAAFALPSVSGAVVLAALAFVATATTDAFSPLAAIAFVAFLVAGAAVGWQRPSALTGMAFLAVVAAAGLLSDSAFDMVWSIASVVVLPFAIGLVYVSLFPTAAPIAAMSVTTPVAVSVPIVAEFGWTAYTPLTSVEPTFSPSAWMWTSTAISVLAVVAASAALVVLQHRRDRKPGIF